MLKKQELRRKRAMRVRKHLQGSSTKPRLSVHKSNKHIQAQLIDDSTGTTLAALSTYSADFRGSDHGTKSKESARKIGERIAEIAKEKNINEVVFDRGRFKYHGILAELADAARTGGLKF